jgi:hypothetical protein
MEGVKSLECSPEELPGVWGWNGQTVTAGTGEALPGPIVLRMWLSERRVL